MAEPYLRQHRGHWQFKIAVPRDLREAFAPRTTIVVSLGVDAKEARLQRWKLKNEWEARFAAMRSGVPISDEDIEREARAYFEAEATTAAMASSEDDPGFEQAGVPLSFIREVEAEADRPEIVQPHIDKIAKRLGAALPPGSQGHQRLANALLTAYHASRTATEPPKSFLPPEAQRIAKQLPEPKARVSGALWSRIFEAYLSELERDPTVAPPKQTIAAKRRAYLMFQERNRDPAGNAITRTMVARWLDALGTERELSNKTLNQYASFCASAWAWGRRRGYINDDLSNPFREQARPKSKKGWLPYTTAELQKLVDAVELDNRIAPKVYGVRSALNWLPIVGLLTGARINELCQMLKSDVRREGKLWFLSINDDDDGKSIKTDAGARRVPVSETLKRCGFLKYVETLPDGEYLFPNLTPGGPDGKRSWHVSKAFTTYRRNLGLTRERTVFHSLRHNFIDAANHARVESDALKEIVGHSQDFTREVYTHGLPLPVLKAAIDRVLFPGLKLTRLHV